MELGELGKLKDLMGWARWMDLNLDYYEGFGCLVGLGDLMGLDLYDEFEMFVTLEDNKTCL